MTVRRRWSPRKEPLRAILSLGVVLVAAVLMASAPIHPESRTGPLQVGHHGETAQAALSLGSLPLPSSSGRALAPIYSSPIRGTPLANGLSCSDCAYYLQEGATIDQACFPGSIGGCSGGAGFSAFYVDVQVPASSYQIGFELNGYTNTGDWFQTIVGENWCEPGLMAQAEIFNNTGISVYGPCIGSTMEILTNDMVQLGLNISTSGATSGEVCFSVYDLTNPQSPFIACQPQPDGGANPKANYFQLASHSGFFTGPMTEIVDPVATGCLSYSAMPTITYLFVAGAYVVQFTPWSDEWNPSTSATCYTTTGSGPWTMYPGAETAQYVDASAASPYGPHWEAAQNTSLLSSGNWWSFTTDAKLPTPVATPASIDAGQASAVGFYEPVGIGHLDSNPTLASWTTTSVILTGCLASSTVENLNCSLNPGFGSDTVQFSIGESGGYTLRSPILTFSVFPDPVVGTLSLSRTALDAGQALTVTGSVQGGSGGATFNWQGLPTGCTASAAPTFSCRPSTAGWFNLSATATDSNGMSATSPVALLHVFPDPSIGIVSTTPPAGSLDVGQTLGISAVATGGSGGYLYAWTGLPLGCVNSSSPSISCVAHVPGPVTVRVVVTDSNGYSVSSNSTVFRVYPDPTVSVTVAQSVVVQASELNLSAAITGGVGPYTIFWNGTPPGCPSSGDLVLSCIPTATGQFDVTVTVVDATGYSTSTTVQVLVEPTVPRGGISPTTGWVILGLASGLIAIVGVGVALSVRRRNRRRRIAMSAAPASGPPIPGAPIDAEFTVVGRSVWSHRPEHESSTPTAPYWSVDSDYGPTVSLHCWNCGHDNTPGSRYCGLCAVPLNRDEAPRDPP